MKNAWIRYLFFVLIIGIYNIAWSAPNQHYFPQQVSLAPAPQKMYRMHNIKINRPEPIVRPNFSPHQIIVRPLNDTNGHRLLQQEVAHPPAHALITENHALITHITQQQAVETQQNHFYWHTHNNMKYAHYRDAQNTNWYGFYRGSTFYWARYHANRWWWYDNHYARWIFWNNGFWWWPTTNALYVYINDNYYPYQDQINSVTVSEPETLQTPNQIPDYGDGVDYQSPDSRRTVQISGQNAEAFLFDTTQPEPELKQYLGAHVATVTFSTRTSGKPLEILLRFQDQSFALFDADGNALNPPAIPNALSDFPPDSASATPTEPTQLDDEE